MLSSTGTVPARDINKPTATRQPTSESGIGQGKVIVISPVHTMEADILLYLESLTGQSDLSLIDSQVSRGNIRVSGMYSGMSKLPENA